jgi:hypothetical protein
MLHFLEEIKHFLQEMTYFLQEMLHFLEEMRHFLQEIKHFLEEMGHLHMAQKEKHTAYYVIYLSITHTSRFTTQAKWHYECLHQQIPTIPKPSKRLQKHAIKHV